MCSISLSHAGLDAADQMERYWRWYRQGENSSTGRCFDIGNGTRAALERWRQTGDPEAGATDSLGNGALMRMAPVAITWRHDSGLAGRMAARSAQTTHNHPLALASAQWFGELLARALQGAEREALLAHLVEGLQEPEWFLAIAKALHQLSAAASI